MTDNTAAAPDETQTRPPVPASDDDVPMRILRGATATAARVVAIALPVYALYWVLGVVEPLLYRTSFLLGAIVLGFLLAPADGSSEPGRSRVTAVDHALILIALVAFGVPLFDLHAWEARAALPTLRDVVLGILACGVVLESTRRTTGPVLPATALLFLAYAWLGPVLELAGLGLIAHRGYGLDRLVGTVVMSLEGMLGVPVDVATTYIALFSTFGALLERSGAGRFFVDWALAAMGRSRSPAAPGRAVTVAGVLLGAVSGSGVANTVTLGSVAGPLLKRASYRAETAAAILASAGIGAILTPPMLGAAAFLIAEFLKISYAQVALMAVVPALLYFLSIGLMIETEARRMNIVPDIAAPPPLGDVTRRGWFHFLPVVAIIAGIALGLTAVRAVFYAMLLAVALSFVDRAQSLRPARLFSAFETAGRGIVPVVCTTATAGIIVGVVTLSGLGLKIAGLIVSLAGGSLPLTVFYAAFAVLVLGLAVPVTASYIIAAVTIAPALVQVGVVPVAAHMFIFYYAVLSEVSPPTALSPVAAAALMRADPIRTMWKTCVYTLPAFVVPFAFTLSPEGAGLLLQAPFWTSLVAIATATIGVTALALGSGGWIRRAASWPERIGFVSGGLLLVAATSLADLIGIALLITTLGAHLLRTRARAVSSPNDRL